MLSRLRHWSHSLLNRLPAAIPCACALCGRDDDSALCEGCNAQFFQRHVRRCLRCALPLPSLPSLPGEDRFDATCGACLKQPPAFDATIAAVDYAAPVDQLVLALKYGSRLALAPLLAAMMRDTLLRTPEFPLPARLACVPLGARRLAERGFNQALEIARPLSRSLGIQLDPQLIWRVRDTRAQALLHPDERRKNIRNAFIVPTNSIDRLRGLHVGVVDDVMTTGETLQEVAATLKRFGAARVTNFVFARTLQK